MNFIVLDFKNFQVSNPHICAGVVQSLNKIVSPKLLSIGKGPTPGVYVYFDGEVTPKIQDALSSYWNSVTPQSPEATKFVDPVQAATDLASLKASGKQKLVVAQIMSAAEADALWP